MTHAEGLGPGESQNKKKGYKNRVREGKKEGILMKKSIGY
jgi:hypothetical protein